MEILQQVPLTSSRALLSLRRRLGDPRSSGTRVRPHYPSRGSQAEAARPPLVSHPGDPHPRALLLLCVSRTAMTTTPPRQPEGLPARRPSSDLGRTVARLRSLPHHPVLRRRPRRRRRLFRRLRMGKWRRARLPPSRAAQRSAAGEASRAQRAASTVGDGPRGGTVRGMGAGIPPQVGLQVA
jgi:hypothetical protein